MNNRDTIEFRQLVNFYKHPDPWGSRALYKSVSFSCTLVCGGITRYVATVFSEFRRLYLLICYSARRLSWIRVVRNVSRTHSLYYISRSLRLNVPGTEWSYSKLLVLSSGGKKEQKKRLARRQGAAQSLQESLLSLSRHDDDDDDDEEEDDEVRRARTECIHAFYPISLFTISSNVCAHDTCREGKRSPPLHLINPLSLNARSPIALEYQYTEKWHAASSTMSILCA